MNLVEHISSLLTLIFHFILVFNSIMLCHTRQRDMLLAGMFKKSWLIEPLIPLTNLIFYDFIIFIYISTIYPIYILNFWILHFHSVYGLYTYKNAVQKLSE